jgi:hypothetical protein
MLNDVKLFLEQCTIPTVGFGPSLTTSELYEEYCDWCAGHWAVHGNDPIREPVYHVKFSRCLVEMGLKKARIGRCTRYFDIILRPYGITVDEFEAMHAAQNNLCAVCGKPNTSTTKHGERILRLEVDRCHKTGKVRALLCNTCNHLLGNARNNVEILQSAISYLEKHAAKPT